MGGKFLDVLIELMNHRLDLRAGRGDLLGRIEQVVKIHRKPVAPRLICEPGNIDRLDGLPNSLLKIC